MFTLFSLLTLFPHFSCFVCHPGTYWNTTDSLKCKQGKIEGGSCYLSEEFKGSSAKLSPVSEFY